MQHILSVRLIGDADQIHRLSRAIEKERYLPVTIQTKDGDLLMLEALPDVSQDVD